jgi:putative endonuclease
MFQVYILRSSTSSSYYCGHTDDLQRRLSEHNRQEFGGGKTTHRHAGTWEIVWSHKVSSRSEAMLLERRIKKRGIVRFLEDEKR